jgi:sRNA-binding carbon storage regulator CsrA
MLVLSRQYGQSIKITGQGYSHVLTVLGIRGSELTLQVSSSNPSDTLDCWNATLIRDATAKISDAVQITLVDAHREDANIGIVAPKDFSVYRLEVLEAIDLEKGRASGIDLDDGLAGSPVPRPQGPKPPSLNVRLNEPKADDESGGPQKRI